MAATGPGATPTSALTDSAVTFGRDVCGDLAAAEQREWLVTNGLGGFASGTVAGTLTRRYHGLLFAAFRPPVGRTLLVARLEEEAEYDGSAYKLSANRWTGGAVDPRGYQHIESFRLDGTTPVWVYAVGDALLEKRIWMEHGANTTYVRYQLLRGGRPLALTLRALVNYRDYHATTHAGDWRLRIEPCEQGLRVTAYDGATPFFLLSDSAVAEPAHDWYRSFFLSVANYRGLDDMEDHLHAGTFRAKLEPGAAVLFALSTEAAVRLDGCLDRAAMQSRDLLARFFSAAPSVADRVPEWIRQLVLAADQFIVRRPLADNPDALTVIAGYHWFSDWGRDTMIALPGLALATGRPEVARNILLTFARFVDRGMLPNVFPDADTTPEYNTVDATLWFFEAARQYFAATNDTSFLADIFPVLADIVDWHLRGTRYNIKADPADGLLFAGQSGVQLTWMDAKIGDWVVTPRIGKPVEVNALWYNALTIMHAFARALKKPNGSYEFLAKRVRENFGKFWNETADCCFDVIDSPGGNEAAIRPNQIFAVSLPESPLMNGQGRKVVDTCARRLLTSHGLRSLAPGEPGYAGHYGGAPRERDAVYHMGTTWGWLIGPFVLAHLRVYKDPVRAAQFLEPFAHHLRIHGLGTASEIFDGDAPFTPRGCIAQAWTVAEILRAWLACNK
jgi:predicted glycogen debranching enzyme